MLEKSALTPEDFGKSMCKDSPRQQPEQPSLDEFAALLNAKKSLKNMKNLIKPVLATLSLACVAQMVTMPASAQLVTIGYWRGGENDSPAPVFNVDGVLGFANSSTVDFTGTYNLSKYGTGGLNTGTAFYASSAAYAGIGGLPSGSSVALITGGDAGFYNATAIDAGTVNFGFQTYVRPNNTTGVQVIAANGGIGNGWSLFTADGTLLGLSEGCRFFVELSGIGFLDSGITVDAGGIVHNIAYVNDNGSNLFYYDFTQVASANLGGINAAGANFSLGFRASDVSRYYTGTIDEARLFTFAPGGFSASELTNYVVPEPSSLALVCVGLGAALAVYRFRRRRRC
jgi:hypothetical protein